MSIDENLMCSFQILKPTDKKTPQATGARPYTPPAKGGNKKSAP